MPGPNGPEATRIEEASILAVSMHVPTAAIALAHLVRESGAWTIDASFGGWLRSHGSWPVVRHSDGRQAPGRLVYAEVFDVDAALLGS
ncbi:MAG TPA: hypothetical protein VK047_07430 [Zeimonas sp.]|jgi:hypothetical protein|nr:hypothetical protein [Zeimonas sp.]